MGNLQVKNLPDDLHDKIRERARQEHRTVSELVTEALRHELARPTMSQWLASLDELPKLDHDIDIQSIMDEVKDEIEGR